MKEEELLYWWKVSKFLLVALFANARRVENKAFLRLRPRKQLFLLSRKYNAFVRTNYIRVLIYVKDIYGQKMKEIGFSTLATRSSIFSLLNVLQDLSLSKTVSCVWLKGVYQSKHNLNNIIPKKGYWRTQLKKDNDIRIWQT